VNQQWAIYDTRGGSFYQSRLLDLIDLIDLSSRQKPSKR